VAASDGEVLIRASGQIYRVLFGYDFYAINLAVVAAMVPTARSSLSVTRPVPMSAPVTPPSAAPATSE
jgi:hypothetical protein